MKKYLVLALMALAYISVSFASEPRECSVSLHGSEWLIEQNIGKEQAILFKNLVTKSLLEKGYDTSCSLIYCNYRLSVNYFHPYVTPPSSAGKSGSVTTSFSKYEDVSSVSRAHRDFNIKFHRSAGDMTQGEVDGLFETAPKAIIVEKVVDTKVFSPKKPRSRLAVKKFRVLEKELLDESASRMDLAIDELLMSVPDCVTSQVIGDSAVPPKR